jgi:Asp-tRNA(Asn)/Glu-tRNA(Gln) amidotransferase A subunit family amidase
MHMSDESRWWDATQVAEAVASGEVTAGEMVDLAVERIEIGDGPLNSVVMRWFEHARELAGRSLPHGPFTGVPFLLKDLWVQYSGQGRTDGNVALAASPPIATEDSVLVSRFNVAGLVTLGRSASPEMGTMPVTETVAHGDTRNPWDTSRTPGGSSGGRCCGGCRGLRARSPRLRRRRLHTYPRLVLRVGRTQALPGPHHHAGSWCRDGPGCRLLRKPNRARQRTVVGRSARPRFGEMVAKPGRPMAGMIRAGEVVPFTPPFNTSGQPAVSLPTPWNADGLPIGVQLVGAYGREDLLLAVAAQLEVAMPWTDRHPRAA